MTDSGRRIAGGGLPHGLVAELDRETRVLDDGRTLVGGAPVRALFLTAAAIAMFEGRRVRVRDAGTASLADRLLGLGMAHPVLSSLPPVDEALATFVVPVRDRPTQLDRLLGSIGPGRRIVVVDDDSLRPEAVARVAAAHGARLVRLEDNRGPAGARNAGLAVVETPFVVFVDSDVVLEPGAIGTLLRHFADPSLGLAAPRVLGLASERPNWVNRYEDARSSLDLGSRSALVRPRSRVSWLPAACIVARVDALGGGFSPELRVAEDVDLVWRLVESGWRVRYEPRATVRHEHRSDVLGWMRRKAFYGTGALGLGLRHPQNIAPVVLAPWSAGLLAVLLAQRRWSLPVAGGILVVVAVRIARKLRRSDHPLRLASRLTADGVSATLQQGSALLLRHWWPLAAIGSVFSRRLRRAVLVAGVLDVVVERRRTRAAMGFATFGIARRLDDLAYGAGVWWASIRGRSLLPLLPDVRSRREGDAAQ